MSVRAISVTEPAIVPITRGQLQLLWRVGATMCGLRAGDLLWVREPYHLKREFDRLAPSSARDRGATPWFTADLVDAPKPEEWLGFRRMARTLPRAWHRQHLRVTGVELRELQSITEAEAKALGYECRAHFARNWDASLMFERHEVRWQDNPTATAFSFERIEGQVP